MKKVYWFGYGGSTKVLEPIIPIIKELDLELITIHEWENASVKWELSTWLSELKKADIIVLPASYEIQPCKSNNRLTQALSIGKPVVCSPLDSYVRIEDENPGCCLIANSIEQWKEYLLKLKNDETFCKEISLKAIEASKKYSIEEITNKWVDVLKSVATKNAEQIDIIIPSYNNVEYLKLCLESIEKNSFFKNKIIISDAGSDEKTWEYYKTLSNVQIIGNINSRLNFSQTCNAAIKISSNDYFVLLNSDVIVSKNWDYNVLIKMKQDTNIAICGVLSNCDRYWLHDAANKPKYNMQLSDGFELVPGMKAFQLEGKLESLYSFMDNSNRSLYGTLTNQEWVAFYATMFNRKCVNNIGLLDPTFKNGGEDYCYCYRAKKMGYRICQAIDSFIFHFGGISRKAYEDSAYAVFHEEDKQNNVYMHEKCNKTIGIFSGLSFEHWDYRNLDQGGIGGSETWVIHISKELSKLGYRVVNFNDCEKEINDGNVQYIPFSKLNEYVEYNYFDYFISSRTTEPFKLPIRSKKNFTIIHDIWLSNNREIPYQEKIDKFLVLSEWHRDFVSEHHDLSKDRLIMTTNGIDLSRFDKKVERNPYRLHWSSSLDRGLDTLLYLFDFIKEKVPELELHIFYGMGNWIACSKYRPEEKKRIEYIQNAMKKDGVYYHGRVGQKQLAEEQLKASLWAYSTDFEESNCITAIESQAAGLPIVASNYAGLRTTVNNSGILIGNGTKGESYTREYRVEFVNKCIQLLTDKTLWQEWSEKSLQNAKKYAWEEIAKQWEKQILI